MEHHSTHHHHQDVGKILLQAQSDLKKIRESLEDEQPASLNLHKVVEKVETEFRLKAEAVLKTVAQASLGVLPSVGAYNFRSVSTSSEPAGPVLLHQGGTDNPPTRLSLHRRLSLPQRVKSRSSTAHSIDPTRHYKGTHVTSGVRPSHQYMAEKKFGITQLQQAPLGRPMGQHITRGKLRKERNVCSLGAPGANLRADPYAVPPIGAKDAAAGLFSLVNRRLIPPNVDLTPALERHPAPMKQAPSRMHDHAEQFAVHNSSAYISPFGFNVSNTKLDVLTGP